MPVAATDLHVEDYGAAGDGHTDDTAAIQACIDTGLSSGGPACIRFAAATYLVDSVPGHERSGNSILSLTKDRFDDTAISLVGVAGGTTIRTTREVDDYSPSDGPPSVLGSATDEQAGQPLYQYVGPVELEGIAISVPNNPRIAGIDGLRFGGLTIRDAEITADDPLSTLPTATHSFGLRLPSIYNHGRVSALNLHVAGFYAGIVFAATDHVVLQNAYVSEAVAGLAFQEPQQGEHAAHLTYVMSEHCRHHLAGWHPEHGVKSLPPENAAYIMGGQLDIEEGRAPFEPVATVLDANDQLRGQLTVHRWAGGVAADPGGVKGARQLQLRSAWPRLGSRHSFPAGSAASRRTASAGHMYYAQIEIPTGAVISGLEYIEASPHVEGNVMAALYDRAGRRIAQRSQGSATPGANSAHRVPFDRPCHAPAGVYHAALVFDGPSRFHGAYTLVPAGATKLESFTCPPSLRVPTEIAAGSLKVPLMSTF